MDSSDPVRIGWIEKEMALVKSCLVADNQSLEKICTDLHLRIRQMESYSAELRFRLEETLKGVCRAGRVEEGAIKEQLEYLSCDLQQSKAQVASLTEELLKTTTLHRSNQAALLQQLTEALRQRDEISTSMRLLQHQQVRVPPPSAGSPLILSSLTRVETPSEKRTSPRAQWQ